MFLHRRSVFLLPVISSMNTKKDETNNMHHPLFYQQLNTSCWVTSMINGIMYLHKGIRPSFMAYRLLHNILVEDGVFYYTKKDQQQFEAVIKAVGICSKTEITHFNGKDVEKCIRNLKYGNQVAICDIGSGGHSILINRFKNGVFEAFDPFWENVKDGESVDKEYETYPPYMNGSNNTVNLRLWPNHLFALRKGKGFQMGAVSMRFATVITKCKP